jgi:hypothetical protein
VEADVADPVWTHEHAVHRAERRLRVSGWHNSQAGGRGWTRAPALHGNEERGGRWHKLRAQATAATAQRVRKAARSAAAGAASALSAPAVRSRHGRVRPLSARDHARSLIADGVAPISSRQRSPSSRWAGRRWRLAPRC